MFCDVGLNFSNRETENKRDTRFLIANFFEGELLVTPPLEIALNFEESIKPKLTKPYYAVSLPKMEQEGELKRTVLDSSETVA